MDVAVTNPSCPTAIIRYRSNTVTDAANLAREQSKRLHYAGWVEENVQPFVMEATGRLGPSATRYLKHITENAGKHRAVFVHQYQAILAYHNGKMFCQWIDNLMEANAGIVR